MRSTRKVFAAMVLLLFVIGGTALAQSRVSGTVSGVVTDNDGAALPGVTVTIYSDALVAGSLQSMTNENGIYRFPSLPVGTYRIEAALSGFNSIRRGGIKVSLGQALTVDLKMSMGVAETITVTAEAPILSVTGNSVATSFDTDFLENQPVQRNFYTIIKAAPGVNADLGSSGSAMLAYGGTTESQNAFTMDGVNVADAAAGQHWILPAIQWMEEIQIGGLGANAEYGGYTGGVINAVIKSGGNDLAGGLEYYFQPESWTSDNDPTTDNETFKFNDLAVSLGGPVQRDKLWFFVSGEIWQQVSTPFGAVDTSDRKIPRGLGKLTYQLSPANRFSAMVEYDNVTNERRGISLYTLPEASSKQKAPGISVSLNWESLINNNNFTALRLTGYDGRDDYLPYNGTGLPGRIDEDSGLAWVNQDLQELNYRTIKTLDGSWNLYKDAIFGKDDSHSFKFGALYETAKSSDVWRRNGGFTYYDDSSTCPSFEAYLQNPACGAYYVERGWGEYDAHMQYDGWAAYAQDSMKLNRFTINAGLRAGGYDGGFEKGHGDSSVYTTSFIDPRLGVVWDVKGDARTAVKVHWGRYHDKMYTYLYDRERSGHAAIPDLDCYWNEDTNKYDDCDTPTVIEARMGNTDHAYVDEALLSFEQQLGPEMLFGLDFVDRGFNNIMAMVNANQNYAPKTMANNPLDGSTIQIWNLLSAPDFVLTTDNGAYRDFQSVTTRFEKRYSKGWSARASVVWTDMKGNILKNNGYANEFRDRNGMINADGPMDMAFSEWEGKLSAAVDLPFRFQFSGQYTYLTGWNWTPYVRVSGLSYNSSIGRDINLLERGSNQFDDRNLLDLRLAWRADLPGKVGLTASLEAFNVTNSDTVLNVDKRWGSYNSSRGTWSARSAYGTATQIERPREIRAGLRLSF